MSRFLVALTLAGLVWLGGLLHALEADGPREYQVKAAFLYNAMKFVSWPDGALGAADNAVSVAILGTTALADMEPILRAKLLRGRPITVKGYSHANDLRGCHVLFISADARDEQREALRAVEGQSVLTVTEVASAASPSAVVTLAVADTKLTFYVNLDSAEAHGLQVSSNFLGLAASVQSTRLKKGSS